MNLFSGASFVSGSEALVTFIQGLNSGTLVACGAKAPRHGARWITALEPVGEYIMVIIWSIYGYYMVNIWLL